MKKKYLIMIVIIWTQVLFSVSVQMSDGLKYNGIFSAKRRGNIYLSEGNMLYELPIKEIVEILNNGTNITEVIINTEDFSYINNEDHKYTIYKHGSNDNQDNDKANRKELLVKRSDQKKDYANRKDVLLKMNEREFAIYELEQKQKQAEMVSNKIDRVSDTLWTIWGVSIVISVVTTIIVLNQ